MLCFIQDKTHLIQMKKVISDEMTKESPSSVVHEISGLIDTPETRSRSQSQSHSPAAPGGSPIPLFVDSTYDAKLKQLQETINYWIRDLVLDSSTYIYIYIYIYIFIYVFILFTSPFFSSLYFFLNYNF